MNGRFQWETAICLGVVLAAMNVANASRANGKPDCERAATAMVAAMARGDSATATASFDAAMKQALPEAAIAAVWTATLAKYGTYAGADVALLSKGTAQAPYVVTIPMRFAWATVDGIVACDADGAIAGFHLVPRPEPEVQAKDASFEAEQDRIQSAGIELGATFYRPRSTSKEASFPLVVLVGGSGPMDRDSTIGANKPMRDIATGLVRKGIGVLAFDKRTFTHPEKPIATVDDEIVDDAVAAIRHGVHHEGVDTSRVFVLGHSLGGTMAPRIALRSSELAGIIVLAPLVEPLDEAYLRQLRYLADRDGKIDESEQAILDDAVAAEQRLGDARQGLAPDGPLPLGIPMSYWKDLWSYDPVTIARKVDRPVLALFAGRDYQVLADESKKKWQAGLDGGPSLRVHVYPMLGHTFMPMADPPDPMLLLEPAHVHSSVIDDVAAWILEQKGRSKGA